jgi:hypothetical protein
MCVQEGDSSGLGRVTVVCFCCVQEGDSSGLGRVTVVCFCCVAGRDGRKFVAIC